MKKIDTVCIVDDDEVYQFTVKFEIERTNLVNKILFFSDGEEAIEFFQRKSDNPDELPDVILLDINMPIMDGWDFLEEFTLLKPGIGKKITLYMVSSSVNNQDIDRAKAISEITDYLVKPITRDKLLKIFNQSLS